MTKRFQILLLSVSLCAGCNESELTSKTLPIEREFETIHEEGLGTVRFFEAREAGEDLWARCFTVPPTFLSASFSGDGRAAVDPFAIPEESKQQIRRPVHTAQQILEKAGITFGDGHYACYYPENSALVVILPSDQMELVEAYTHSIGPGPSQPILVYSEVYEVEEAFHHQLKESIRGEVDHTPERDALFKSAKLGESSLKEASVLTCTSGMKATAEVDEFTAKVEVDPMLSADGVHVSLKFQYWDEENGSDEKVKIETQLTVESGRYVSLGSWKVAHSAEPRFRHLMMKVEVANIQE